MTIREDIVAEARTWLGTTYRHQGRLKGVSVDCAGLVIGVGRALGLEVNDRLDYAKRPDGTLKDFVYSQTLEVVRGAEQIGDIALFHWRNDPFHLAIITGEDTIIHAFAINRKVVEHNIDEKWKRQILCFRSYVGVE